MHRHGNLHRNLQTKFDSRILQTACFLLFALVARISTFGDLNYFQDELFFFYTGQRMHDGLLLYVDIWDRKPPGLFTLYYLIAGISRSVLAYQIAAWLFVAMTAQVINMIAERLAGRMGAMLAGGLYISLLPLFGGGGGQVAIFYNLLVAIAALLVVGQIERLRNGAIGLPIPLAMACAGLAITFKQTALFEGAFLGGFVLWHYARAGADYRRVAALAFGLALIGAAPMLCFAAYYAAIGHFYEFWHAMVLANLHKAYNPGNDLLIRLGVFALMLAPCLFFVLASFVRARENPEFHALRYFMAGWLAAAFLGFGIVPNLIDHYALPVLVPLSVASAPFLQRRAIGTICGIGLIGFNLISGHAFDFSARARSRAAMNSLTEEIRKRDPNPRLLVYDGPVYLYALTGSHPPSALALPLHLDYLPEANASHLDTVLEFHKILDWKPTIVVIRRSNGANLINPATKNLIEDYVTRNCRWTFSRPVYDMFGQSVLDIHGGCANGRQGGE
jgi:hypothetical protein